MFEIERKFLILTDLNKILSTAHAINRLEISQVYLKDTGEWTQRVRRVENYDDASISFIFTMKKRVTDLTCIELETNVSEKFYDMIAKAGTPPVLKTRYDILWKKHRWHVDQFLDPEFDGLVVAEIELKSESETFENPPWLGVEVTDRKRYRNARMARKLEEMRTLHA